MFYYGSARKTKAQMVAALPGDVSDVKLVANNTLRYIDHAGDTVLRLHGTDILTLRKGGGFLISTGGWNTHTTRDRLNGWLPTGYSVFTRQGTLYLRTPGGRDVPFLERIAVGPRGGITVDVTPKGVAAERKLIDRFMAHARKRGLPTVDESGGDPWVIGTVDRGIMLDWLRSRYFTRTMYGLALRHAGLTDYAIGLFMAQADRKGGKLDATDYRRIRRYIRACLGWEN